MEIKKRTSSSGINAKNGVILTSDTMTKTVQLNKKRKLEKELKEITKQASSKEKELELLNLRLNQNLSNNNNNNSQSPSTSSSRVLALPSVTSSSNNNNYSQSPSISSSPVLTLPPITSPSTLNFNVGEIVAFLYPPDSKNIEIGN